MIDKLEEYRKAVSIMPGAAVIFSLTDDDDMKVYYFTEKTLEFSGMSIDRIREISKSNHFNLLIEDDRKLVISKIKTSIEKHEQLDVVYRQRNDRCGMIWVHMTANIVTEIYGHAVFIATLVDVTKEMLSSANIMESTDRAICVIEKGSKVLLYGNKLFYELINSKPSDTMGAYCYDVLCGNPAFKCDNSCLCFSTINIEKPFEYYNPINKKYLSMYGREVMWGEHEAYVFFLNDQSEEKFKEKQLASARERFEMTLDNSDLYVWEYDMVNHQCINPDKAVREYGLPRIIDNYPEGLYDMGHTPPETIAQIKEVDKRLRNGESDFSVERRTIDKYGNSQWMKVSYKLQFDVNKRPIRALVCGIDITDQKRKQAAYEEEINRKTRIKTGTTILCVLNLTDDCVQHNADESAIIKKYFDKGSIDEIMNSVCDDFIMENDREAYKKHFNRERMLSNYKQGILHGSLIHQFMHRSGWYESAYDLILNPATGKVEAITSIKDVSDQVRTKKVVSKLTAIDYDLIITADIESGEVYRYDSDANAETSGGRKMELYEYERHNSEIVEKFGTKEEFEFFRHATDTKTVMENLKKMPVYTFMTTVNMDDKISRKRYIYSYLDRSHKTILLARQDVTEAYLQEEKQKQKLAEALEKANIANKAKTSFLSRVSHDMRTPLNGVLGITNLMKDEVANPAVLKDLANLELSGKYLLDLINDVLDVSSIETGNLKLNPAVCEGRMILNNVVQLIKPNIDAKNITLTLNVDEMAFVLAYVDEARLQQIALNVLGNAAKFTPNGGKISLIGKTIHQDKDHVINEFTIRDNGIGMEASFLPHLFEPFTQENAAITNSKTGTGLGMSITKRLVELMNGTISVESEKGVGTTFHITIDFPIATEQQLEESSSISQAKSIQYHLDGKRILLCEDHPINQQIALRLLEKVGAIVEIAENGKIGVEKFEKSEIGYYDAILMDIRMPVMDGLEATRTMRELKRSDADSIPIIAMTANALSEDIQNTMEAGMNAHIPKPVNPQRLYQNLDKYINVHQVIAKQKILVVEDLEVNRDMLAEALKSEYDIYQAENGEEALKILKSTRGIALVITDIEMPKIDGMELIKTMRSSDENRHVAIIAYTQHEHSDMEERLLKLGVNDFIYKPLNTQVVKLRVKNALTIR